MISPDKKGLGKPLKCPGAIIVHQTRSSMNRFAASDDIATECLADDLVTETYSQDRNGSVQFAHDFQTTTRLLWSARPRRKHDGVGAYFDNLGRRNFVVPHDLCLLAKPTQVTCQVVDEAIIVVDQEYHSAHLRFFWLEMQQQKMTSRGAS